MIESDFFKLHIDQVIYHSDTGEAYTIDGLWGYRRPYRIGFKESPVVYNFNEAIKFLSMDDPKINNR